MTINLNELRATTNNTNQQKNKEREEWLATFPELIRQCNPAEIAQKLSELISAEAKAKAQKGACSATVSLLLCAYYQYKNENELSCWNVIKTVFDRDNEDMPGTLRRLYPLLENEIRSQLNDKNIKIKVDDNLHGDIGYELKLTASLKW